MKHVGELEHGTPRPLRALELDGAARWCAHCCAWIEVAPVIGDFAFLLFHPDEPHPRRPVDH